MLTRHSVFAPVVLGLLIFPLWSISGENCYFHVDISSNDTMSGRFGDKLDNITSPCIVRFSTSTPGAVRLDFNNKIFTNNKNRKRSCLSEYVRVDSGDRSVLLCHSNVTTPVQIGDTENSGYFDAGSPVMVTLHWSGDLDTARTQYLGRFEFRGLTSVIGREETAEDKRSASIATKLKLYLEQKNIDVDNEKLFQYQFKSRESCYQQDGAVCEHSQFCGDSGVFSSSQCNTSLYLCIGQELQCDGGLDCLPGDMSDELGCHLPIVMVSTGSLVLGLVVMASSACVWQHHVRMSDSGMTRYKQDLVRRKDKVKARNFENKKNKPEPSSSSSMEAKDLSSMTPLTQLSSPPKPPAPVPVRGAVTTRRISAKDLSAASMPSSQQKITNHPQAASNQQSSVLKGFEEKNNGNGRPQVSASASLPYRTAVVRTASTDMQTEIDEDLLDDKDIKRTLSSDHLLEAKNGTSSSHGGGQSRDPTRVMSTCQSEDSVATCATRESRVVSVHSLKSVKSANGDICSQSSKGGYGYRFDFRSSCEFEFTEDVYI